MVAGPAGDADEAWFVAAFEDQPTIIVTTRADFLEIQNKLVSVLDKKDDDWPPKIDAVSESTVNIHYVHSTV